ncbi:MAG: hypothetical protein RMY29_002245 [Nostoc sp. CreGUA01]
MVRKLVRQQQRSSTEKLSLVISHWSLVIGHWFKNIDVFWSACHELGQSAKSVACFPQGAPVSGVDALRAACRRHRNFVREDF